MAAPCFTVPDFEGVCEKIVVLVRGQLPIMGILCKLTAAASGASRPTIEQLGHLNLRLVGEICG